MAQTVFRIDAVGLYWSNRPNRSLAKFGRALWVYVFAINASLVAAVAVAIGAWPVVPFAGLEVLLVALAFWMVSRHDDDFEQLEFSGDRFRWSSRHGTRVSKMQGNVAWLSMEWKSVRGNRLLRLRYAGKEVYACNGVADGEERRLQAGLARVYPTAPSLRAAVFSA